MESPLAVLFQITRILDAHSVAYVVVGSFASSMRGMYRATADIDIVADLTSQQVGPLVAALQDDFYVDEQAAHRAVARGGSFNAIHLEAIFKIDIFIPPTGGFGRQQLARRQLEQVGADAPRSLYVATAEDTLLAKLSWLRAGGGVSQAQWADVRGIIGAQGARLDVAYLRIWADQLGVRDLLEQALASDTNS
jgi:hypothetical protein